MCRSGVALDNGHDTEIQQWKLSRRLLRIHELVHWRIIAIRGHSISDHQRLNFCCLTRAPPVDCTEVQDQCHSSFCRGNARVARANRALLHPEHQSHFMVDCGVVADLGAAHRVKR